MEVLICNCWEGGLGQFFGSTFDQPVWRVAFLGSDLYNCCDDGLGQSVVSVVCEDASLGSKPQSLHYCKGYNYVLWCRREKLRVNKPETALYRAPTFSLLLVSHGGISSGKPHQVDTTSDHLLETIINHLLETVHMNKSHHVMQEGKSGSSVQHYFWLISCHQQSIPSMCLSQSTEYNLFIALAVV